MPVRVLILCTGNSARSQMAEALFHALSKGAVEVHSAGSAPQPMVHPTAIAVLRDRYGIGSDGLHPKHLQQFVGQPFDYVITVCDRAAETCPVFPGHPQRLHWSFEDPAAVIDTVQQRKAFEEVAQGLAQRITAFLEALR